MVKLDIAHSMSQDFGGASSGAMRGAGGRRHDRDSLDHALIKSALYSPFCTHFGLAYNLLLFAQRDRERDGD